MTSLRTGQSALGYKLKRRLGTGAYGEVWQGIAEDGKSAALKFIELVRAKEEERSLKWIAQIRHPHVIPFIKAQEWRGRLVIVMELADATLHDRLTDVQERGEPGLPVADLLRYLSDAALGLDYLNARMHEVDGEKRRIFHRDIKPQNLLLVGDRVKIGDFGLAKAQALTIAPQTGIGTVSFMAPEAFEGKTSLTMDQYSLAVCYYVLRTGELPFAGDSAGEIMHKVLTNAPDLDNLPAHEQAVVARALEKDSANRFEDCQAFVETLKSVAMTMMAPASFHPEGRLANVLLPTMSYRGPVAVSKSGQIVLSGPVGRDSRQPTPALCKSRNSTGAAALPVRIERAESASPQVQEKLTPASAEPRSDVALNTLGPAAPLQPSENTVSWSSRISKLLRRMFPRHRQRCDH